MDEKRYTNVHVGNGFSVKSKFAKPMTLEQARENGKKEELEKPYLKYLGVMGVDITTKKLNQILKEAVTI
jgi:hypothetical protein